MPQALLQLGAHEQAKRLFEDVLASDGFVSAADKGAVYRGQVLAEVMMEAWKGSETDVDVELQEALRRIEQLRR